MGVSLAHRMKSQEHQLWHTGIRTHRRGKKEEIRKRFQTATSPGLLGHPNTTTPRPGLPILRYFRIAHTETGGRSDSALRSPSCGMKNPPYRAPPILQPKPPRHPQLI